MSSEESKTIPENVFPIIRRELPPRRRGLKVSRASGFRIEDAAFRVYSFYGSVSGV